MAIIPALKNSSTYVIFINYQWNDIKLKHRRFSVCWLIQNPIFFSSYYLSGFPRVSSRENCLFVIRSLFRRCRNYTSWNFDAPVAISRKHNERRAPSSLYHGTYLSLLNRTRPPTCDWHKRAVTQELFSSFDLKYRLVHPAEETNCTSSLPPPSFFLRAISPLH